MFFYNPLKWIDHKKLTAMCLSSVYYDIS